MIIEGGAYSCPQCQRPNYLPDYRVPDGTLLLRIDCPCGHSFGLPVRALTSLPPGITEADYLEFPKGERE